MSPLKRRKGLKADPEKQAEWERRSRAKASDAAARKPRKRVKPMSDKRKAEGPERDRVRKAVEERDQGKCRIAPFFPDTPCGGGWGPHHLLKAGQGGPYTEENLIWSCNVHNDLVEDEPEIAKAMGLVIKPTT